MQQHQQQHAGRQREEWEWRKNQTENKSPNTTTSRAEFLVKSEPGFHYKLGVHRVFLLGASDRSLVSRFFTLSFHLLDAFTILKTRALWFFFPLCYAFDILGMQHSLERAIN